MKIAICGPGGCGKDTAASIISKVWGLKYTHSTSYQAREYVFKAFEKLNPGKYANAKAAHADRINNREFWAKAIDEYNHIDAARLYREHLASGQEILTGIRKSREFSACRAENLFDIAIWIHRPGFESTDKTQEYGWEDCDMILLNDTPELLFARVNSLSCFRKQSN